MGTPCKLYSLQFYLNIFQLTEYSLVLFLPLYPIGSPQSQNRVQIKESNLSFISCFSFLVFGQMSETGSCKVTPHSLSGSSGSLQMDCDSVQHTSQESKTFLVDKHLAVWKTKASRHVVVSFVLIHFGCLLLFSLVVYSFTKHWTTRRSEVLNSQRSVFFYNTHHYLEKQNSFQLVLVLRQMQHTDCTGFSLLLFLYVFYLSLVG